MISLRRQYCLYHCSAELVFQNLYGSLPTINAMGQFFLPLAQAKQSVIDIRDVAAVVVTALTQSGHDQTYTYFRS